MSDSIDELKAKFSCKTSESLFGIAEQPKEQCPLIDSILQGIKDESANLQYAIRQHSYDKDLEALVSDVDSAEWTIRNLDSDLEKLRSNISLIREWGLQWKSLSMCLLKNQENIEDYISI